MSVMMMINVSETTHTHTLGSDSSVILQGHVFAMEISSGEEFYIACDNTGTPLAVFSNNGLLLKQVCVCACLTARQSPV